MKPLFYLLFCFLLTGEVQGQNCKTLEQKSFFKSVRFGGPIPDELTNCSKAIKLKYSNYTHVQVMRDSLQQRCNKKYADLFHFLSVPFSFAQLDANNKGELFFVEMYSFFDDNRSGDSITYNPPPNFTRLYKKLESLYGKPNRTEVPTKADSLFIREKGMPLMVAWECNNIHLRLKIHYGARQKMQNVLDIQIVNRAYELLPEVEKTLQ
jgi:hypothetical protein